MAERPEYQFKSVQLLKDQSLGIGSYGAVCKAKCDDLLCAAKIIHPTLFDPTALQEIDPQKEHRLPIRRFEQECEFVSAIRHPNIVQCLGMFRDMDTNTVTCLPVLLMELMDDSLTHFLESSTQPIPYHIQVNICHDVTLALSFLHSNNIIHRDLSGNNVLLIDNVRAKVTDFGMARLGDINPQATRFTNTRCPGTNVYMPPEAVQENPVYTEKIDCFSFGVIIIQILTRQFPNPGDRLERVKLNHPGLRKGSVLVEVPEIDRRQNHISQVDPNHSFLPIALDCLKDEGSERPSAHQLCERVADLKGMPKYIDSARTMQDKDEVIRSQAIRITENEHTISSKDEEIQQLRQQLQQERDHVSRERQLNQQLRELQQESDQTLRVNKTQLEEKERQLRYVNHQLRQLQLENDQRMEEKAKQIEERERQLGHVNQQLEASEQVIAQFERRIAELERQLENDQARVNRMQLQERERQLGHVNQQLEASEQVVAQFERRIAELELLLSQREQQKTKADEQIAELEQCLSQREQQKAKANSKGKESTSFKLRWREGKRAPWKMYRWFDAIVDGSTVYVRNEDTVKIYSYACPSDSWSHLPDCIYGKGSIAIIRGLLTTIGGYSSTGTHFNELYSLTGKGKGRRWVKRFPPMPTKRRSTTAVCTGTTLIVAGGQGKDGVLSTVEVMNTENRQWSTVANLPEPMYVASVTVFGDSIYMLGGWKQLGISTMSVYTCSMSTLVQSYGRSSAQEVKTSLIDKAGVWSQIADLPVTCSTCESFHGRLLAIGGKDSGKSTTAVYMYDPHTNSWEIISHITTGRYDCFTAVLPDNQLMVVGGVTDGGTTDTVEFASV